MTDEIHPSVNFMEAAIGQPSGDHGSRQTGGQKLLPSDHSVLSARQSRYEAIHGSSAALSVHTTFNPALGAGAPSFAA